MNSKTLTSWKDSSVEMLARTQTEVVEAKVRNKLVYFRRLFVFIVESGSIRTNIFVDESPQRSSELLVRVVPVGRVKALPETVFTIRNWMVRPLKTCNTHPWTSRQQRCLHRVLVLSSCPVL